MVVDVTVENSCVQLSEKVLLLWANIFHKIRPSPAISLYLSCSVLQLIPTERGVAHILRILFERWDAVKEIFFYLSFISTCFLEIRIISQDFFPYPRWFCNSVAIYFNCFNIVASFILV